MNAASDLREKYRYPAPPARNELEAHTIDAKNKIFLRALKVRVAALESDERMAALRKLLSESSLGEDMKIKYASEYEAIQLENFHIAQIEEALQLATNSTQFSGIEATLGSERAPEMAVGAWRVAAEAGFVGDLVVNGRAATQVEIFDAVLCWMTLTGGGPAESQSAREMVPFAVNCRNLAIAALEKFQNTREAEANSAREARRPFQLQERPLRLLDGIRSFTP